MLFNSLPCSVISDATGWLVVRLPQDDVSSAYLRRFFFRDFLLISLSAVSCRPPPVIHNSCLDTTAVTLGMNLGPIGWGTIIVPSIHVGRWFRWGLRVLHQPRVHGTLSVLEPSLSTVSLNLSPEPQLKDFQYGAS